MKIKRALRKFFRDLGIEADIVSEAVEGVVDLVEEEIEAKTKTDEPKEPEKDKEQSEVSEVEVLKAEHAKELAKVRLDAKIDAELGKLNIREGYEDIVRNMIDFEKVSLDEKGALSGLKEQTDAFVKDKSLLFDVKDEDEDEKKSTKGDVPPGFEILNGKLPEGKQGEPDLDAELTAAFTSDLPQTK